MKTLLAIAFCTLSSFALAEEAPTTLDLKAGYCLGNLQITYKIASAYAKLANAQADEQAYARSTLAPLGEYIERYSRYLDARGYDGSGNLKPEALQGVMQQWSFGVSDLTDCARATMKNGIPAASCAKLMEQHKCADLTGIP